MINLRKFNLEALDLSKHEHFLLVNRLAELESTKYISKRLLEFVKEPNNKEEFETGKTYIVWNGEQIVGLIGTKDLDRKNYLEAWILVTPEMRGKKYGTIILEQITPYLIEVVKNLEDVKLVINKSNYASKKMAINVGYIRISDEGNFEEDTYRYFGK